MSVEFRLLGSVEASIDGRAVDLGPARQRCVLVALLVDVNHVVPVDRLVDRVWGEHPARNARGALHSYLSRLRRTFAVTREVHITHQSGGYVLTVNEAAVDVHRFRRLVSDARVAEDEDLTLVLFERALGLWRGEPFTGLDTPWISEVRGTLERERYTATLDHIDLRSRRGQHTALLPMLSVLTKENPLDERIAGQLMLALYHCGRPAEALDIYRQTRTRLADELGTEPSSPLQQLHHQILTVDPDLVKSPSAVRSPVPRQLPAAPRSFVGRDAEMNQLTAALDAQAESGATVAIHAVVGAGGIGKTWLALHWAHRHVDRFPDGQLFVNLRGFDPTGEPMPTPVAVRGFLDALGVAPAAIPPGLDAQTGLYRSLVADKHMLIVLDNARDTSQVAALLPGSPTCTVLVTSRGALTGLVTTHGARPMALDVLDLVEARELLTRHIGRQRMHAEPAAVEELLRLGAGLPWALSIVAARAATRPHLPLTALTEELREAGRRLDVLDTGEADLNLRAVFSWSYHALTAEAAALFALLGAAPGPDISLPAAVSLVALPPAETATLLRELESAHLVQQPVAGRYRMHDLIRLYAAEQARPDPSGETPLRRLLDHYLHTAYNADRLLYPARKPIELAGAAEGCRPHPLNDRSAASAWFDAELPNLLASQRFAARRNWHLSVWQLAWTLETVVYRRGYPRDHLALWRRGLAAAEQLGDIAGQAIAHRYLSRAYARVGPHTAALRHAQQSLTLAERTGDLDSQAHAHHNLARIWEQQGNDQRALEFATRAHILFRALEDPAWEARTLGEVGWCQARLGHFDQAHDCSQSALTLFHRQHNHNGEAHVLDTLGYIAHHTGQHDKALDYFQQAATQFHNLDAAYSEADTLVRLGEVHQVLGRYEQARDALRRALELCRTQHRTEEVERVQHRLAELGC